ncbi:helix-turn-helix domain-containing protein [Treponema pedis]|uniref:AlbA family DNA-binding domain-containing protein n=2 Tax=Treponema pedis TaxID=409322 RepID=UPI0003F84494|nr:RNA-binding domain-containing protein [Treponema pedis]
MNLEEVNKLIQSGEKIDVEFKESKDALTKDIYDSVCSFNNRNGGHILLGVNDKRKIVGVNPDKIDKIIKEFTTSINNSQKVYPPLYLVPVSVKVGKKTIIYIRIPEGCQVCRHNGKIWDRSYDGDINITDNSELVYKMYARKQSSYFVNKVYPNLGIDFLDTLVIEKAGKMAIAREQDHSWKYMDDEELLRSANLILTDPETNKEGITLASILLFGKDNSIMSVLAQHKTDAIFRVENKDRYDDRDVIITILLFSGDYLTTRKKERMLVQSAESIVVSNKNVIDEIINYEFSKEWINNTSAKLKLLSKLDRNYENISILVNDSIDGVPVFLMFDNYYYIKNDSKPDKVDFVFQSDIKQREYLEKVFQNNFLEKKFSAYDGNYEMFYPIKYNNKIIVLYFQDRQRYGKVGS